MLTSEEKNIQFVTEGELLRACNRVGTSKAPGVSPVTRGRGGKWGHASPSDFICLSLENFYLICFLMLCIFKGTRQYKNRFFFLLFLEIIMFPE